MEEYTREFEKVVMICDLRENEDHTIMRHLGGLNESVRNVVELQHYTTLDEVCSLAHRVKLQKKAKLKKEPPKALTRSYPFDKGSYPPPSRPQNSTLGLQTINPMIQSPLQAHLRRGDATSATVLDI